MEKMLSELMIKDMKAKADPAQYGNAKGTSIQDYLVCKLHQIMTALDKKSQNRKVLHLLQI